jgi:hypothetical protein
MDVVFTGCLKEPYIVSCKHRSASNDCEESTLPETFATAILIVEQLTKWLVIDQITV